MSYSSSVDFLLESGRQQTKCVYIQSAHRQRHIHRFLIISGGLIDFNVNETVNETVIQIISPWIIQSIMYFNGLCLQKLYETFKDKLIVSCPVIPDYFPLISFNLIQCPLTVINFAQSGWTWHSVLNKQCWQKTADGGPGLVLVSRLNQLTGMLLSITQIIRLFLCSNLVLDMVLH